MWINRSLRSELFIFSTKIWILYFTIDFIRIYLIKLIKKKIGCVGCVMVICTEKMDLASRVQILTWNCLHSLCANVPMGMIQITNSPFWQGIEYADCIICWGVILPHLQIKVRVFYVWYQTASDGEAPILEIRSVE